MNNNECWQVSRPMPEPNSLKHRGLEAMCWGRTEESAKDYACGMQHIREGGSWVWADIEKLGWAAHKMVKEQRSPRSLSPPRP
jgi:hypothetical protein